MDVCTRNLSLGLPEAWGGWRVSRAPIGSTGIVSKTVDFPGFIARSQGVGNGGGVVRKRTHTPHFHLQVPIMGSWVGQGPWDPLASGISTEIDTLPLNWPG